MSARDSHVFHIQNLIEEEPEAQVVGLYYAERLEKEIAELKAENERLTKLLERTIKLSTGFMEDYKESFQNRINSLESIKEFINI